MYQLSFLMETLTNIINQSTIVGTPSATLNSVSLLLKVSKYDQPIIQNKLLQLQVDRHKNYIICIMVIVVIVIIYFE